MNIAILLGVSRYENENNLPACANDIERVRELLKATGKYDDILCISKKTDSAEVKEKITRKIDEFETEDIEEIFFYYSGHGDFYQNEFYYLLSDYNIEKRKQTSLENSELDNWLKSLNPSMTIKIVDACHSGVMYIKEDEERFQDFLNKSSKPFTNKYHKCYFMFSSRADENSYIDKETNLSNFTKYFLDAFKNHTTNEIRIKDIMDYISDNFESSLQQTPFFVIQAGLTEKFSSMSKIKTMFSSSKEEMNISMNKPKDEIKTLESLVKKESESYYTKEKAFDFFEELETKINSYKNFELTPFYDIKSHFISLLDYNNEPDVTTIGKWLKDNENEYFAEHKIKRVELPPMPRLRNESIILPYKQEPPRFRSVVSGYRLSIDCPYEIIVVDADPKYPNLVFSQCVIAFVLSKTEIRFFYTFATYKDINWDEIAIDDNIKWYSKSLTFKSQKDILDYVSQGILNNFSDFLIKKIKEKFGKTEDSEESDENSEESPKETSEGTGDKGTNNYEREGDP